MEMLQKKVQFKKFVLKLQIFADPQLKKIQSWWHLSFQVI